VISLRSESAASRWRLHPDEHVRNGFRAADCDVGTPHGGGLVGVADQYDTIGNSIWVYQNPQMLALNADDFAGKPLTNDPTNQNSQIWTGTMSNGDTIVGLFNRETTAQTRSLVQRHRTRGYGQRERLVAAGRPGPMSSVSMERPPHGSMVLRLSKGSGTCTPQSSTFNQIADWTYNNPPPAVSASASSGLPVTFEVALGPATVQGNRVRLLASLERSTWWRRGWKWRDVCCSPTVQSFNATGPHQDNMFLFGTFTNWTSIRMQVVGGVWVADNVSIPAGSQQLKFAKYD
jgi:hypothetical protein